MRFPRLYQALFGLLAVFTLTMAPACKRATGEEKEIKELSQKAAELDKLSQQANVTGATQTQKLQQAGVTDIKPNAETLQLTEEQKKALEERIKAEKNSSYQSLLQEVLDKDKEIKELNEKVSKLRAALPKPDVAKANESHYGMAMRFLKKKGVSEEEARRLISRVLIMDKLAPGFEVYHFYANGVYGSWVSQGKAKITPTELQAEEKAKIEGERDTAVAQGEKLQEEVNDLATQKKQIEEEIAGLRTEKTKLIDEMNALSATNEKQKSKLNSLHYLVGERKGLEKKGVIVIPVFAKDRSGAKWTDDLFDHDLDLRSSDEVKITAQEAGVKAIGKINVVPGSLVKDEHYKLTIAEDKQSATIKILTKDRFRNEKVVFAVSE
jgi:uncharacterized coiled-coil DUF342 family protein